MFKSTAARATAVVVVVAALGGTTALAASRATPSPGTSQKPGGQPGQSQAKREGNRVGGQVTAVTETELTIDHKTRPRGPRPGGQPAGSITFVMDGDTKVYLAGDRDTDIGRGAIHVDDRVGVKFTEAGDKKLAKVVVVLPDGHAGRVESKDADGHSFTIKTRDGDTIKVTTDANTKFVKGRGKRREPGSFADLEVGQRVAVAGDDTGPGTFAARVVHYPARGPRQG